MISFNTKRFLKAARWDFMTNWNVLFGVTLTMAFVLFGMFELISLSNSSDSINIMLGVTTVTFVFYSTAAASTIFSNMKKKQWRISFLILPASNLEKYLCRIVWASLYMVVAFLAALILADSLRLILSFVFGEGKIDTVTVPFVQLLTGLYDQKIDTNVFIMGTRSVGKDSFMLNSLVMSMELWILSVYILGGTLFRRVSWLMTTISMTILSTIFGSLMIHVIKYLPSIHFIEYLSSFFSYDRINFIWAITIIIFAFAVFNIFISYNLFKRMQVINNKWINI